MGNWWETDKLEKKILHALKTTKSLCSGHSSDHEISTRKKNRDV